MRKTNQLHRIALVAAIAISVARPARAVDFSEKDKQVHAGLSFAGVILSYGATRYSGWSHKKSLWTGIFLTAAAGYAKEISDKHSDEQDLQADAVGILLGAAIPVIIYEW